MIQVENIEKATEIVQRVFYLSDRMDLLNENLKAVNAKRISLMNQQKNLANQKDMLEKHRRKLYNEIHELVGNNTCWTCFKANCGIKHDVFSPKCVNYEDLAFL